MHNANSYLYLQCIVQESSLLWQALELVVIQVTMVCACCDMYKHMHYFRDVHMNIFTYLPPYCRSWHFGSTLLS